MRLLQNTIQEYAWGSHSAIPALLGRPSPSAKPQAELWMGAHPAAPSRVEHHGRWVSLLEVLAEDPPAQLGAPLVARYGGRLPFLFKVLAAKQPLSLQAHPNLAQAEEGFARESGARIPLDAPNRCYKDANHKPEILVALGSFEALCGFRPAEETREIFSALQVSELEPAISTLQATPDVRGVRAVFHGLMKLPAEARADVARACVEGCRAHVTVGGVWTRECAWAMKLGELYPGDIGAVTSLMLNLLHLEDGEAIYLPAGNLHAYLEGVGVELMANSDNVLRGGLTPKHVDVPELLRVLDFTPGRVVPLTAEPTAPNERTYATPTPEFRLTRVDLRAGERCTPERRGPEILLCTEGPVRVTGGAGELTLARGSSAFVAASEPQYTLHGPGALFRATAGE